MKLKHNRKGRSIGTPADSRFLKHDKPPRPFIWLPVELLESAAFRALSGNGKHALLAICAVHGRAGAAQNGALAVAYATFEAFGIRRASIRRALDELDALGFVKRTFRGHRVWGNEGGLASEYRLTWRAAFVEETLLAPTNEWAKFGDNVTAADAARGVARSKRRAAPPGREYICRPDFEPREAVRRYRKRPHKVAKLKLTK